MERHPFFLEGANRQPPTADRQPPHQEQVQDGLRPGQRQARGGQDVSVDGSG